VLKYLPNILAPWKRDIQKYGRLEAAANVALVEGVKKDIEANQVDEKTVAGTLSQPRSLTQNLLMMKDKEGIALSDRDFSFVPASLFGAGSDTTASTMCSAILAFVTHPHTLKAAQAELDTVVGLDRTPGFADEPNLPYIRALAKEVLRWRPVAVLGGTPHSSTEDDVYEGWKIPADTTVLGNSWAINLNAEYYPEPDNFDPARFLDVSDPRVALNLKGKAHPAKSGHSSFGWGRRICPGADLAANSLFIALSKIIWAYDILPIQGRVYDTFDYTDGFNIRPKKFECQIQIRNEERRKVLAREMRDAEQEMEKFPAFD